MANPTMKRLQIILLALCAIALIAVWLLAMAWLAGLGPVPHCNPAPGWKPGFEGCGG